VIGYLEKGRHAAIKLSASGGACALAGYLVAYLLVIVKTASLVFLAGAAVAGLVATYLGGKVLGPVRGEIVHYTVQKSHLESP
jgi:hypothetical protein